MSLISKAFAPHKIFRRDNTDSMDYSVGSIVRVRLYSGQIVDANITAIKSHRAGRKIHIVYGNVTAVINPAQIIEVQMLPKDGAKRLSTSQVLREIAEDYRHLAADAHGNAVTGDLRTKNYHWLIKLADKIAAKHTAVVKD
jgi:hypothetical protein